MKNASKFYSENQFFCIFIAIVSIILMVVMTLFFAPFAVLENKASDMAAHVEFALQLPNIFDLGVKDFLAQTSYSHILSYPLWHCLYLLIYRVVTDIKLATGLTNAFFVVVTYIVMACIFYRELETQNKKYIAPLLSLLMTFVGSIYVPAINQDYYLGQLTFNAWHNPTTIAVKPFTITTVYIFVLILRDVLEMNQEKENKKFVIFAVLLAMSAFAKPSFVQAFAPVVVVYCVINFLMHPKSGFIFGLKAAFSMIPVGLVLILQYCLSLQNSGGIGIELFKVWNLFTTNVTGSLIISILFPMIIYVLFAKYILSDKFMQIGLLFFVSAVMQFSLFYLHVNPNTGDFVWGAYLATGMFFIVAIIQWINRPMNALIKILLGGVLGAHVLCGVVYWIEIWIVREYKISLTLFERIL